MRTKTILPFFVLIFSILIFFGCGLGEDNDPTVGIAADSQIDIDQQNSDGSDVPAEADDGSDGSDVPAEVDDESDDSDVPAEADDESDGSDVPAEADDGSDGSDVPAEADDGSDGSDVSAEVDDESDGSDVSAEVDDESDGSDVSAEADDESDGSNASAEADDDEVPRPEGWTKETHGKKGDPNYEVVFPDNKVNRLDITIAAADWQAMMDDMEQLWGPRPGSGFGSGCGSSQNQAEEEVSAGCSGESSFGFPDENPVYKPCDMVFEGKTWYHVGIRFKGSSSLQASWRSGSYKLPLRIKTDKFEDEFPEIDNQRFYGFQKLSLSSNWADNSFLREKVVADIFRDAGVPAPHTAFYRVFIDYGEGSKYFGLYTMVEIPDKPMLETQFTDNGGNLYKPKGVSTTFSIYREEDFDKENNEDEADFSDVRALYDALNADRADAAVWRANLETTLNVDGFLRWLAVNTTIQNWDTYGLRGHNYYLYNDPGDTQLHWIPYDNNLALTGGPGNRALSLELDKVRKTWPLIRYLIDDPVYHAKYVQYVEETVTTTFYPERMRPIYKAAHDMIRPYVVGDEGEMPGYTTLGIKASFDRGLTFLNQHVQDRLEAAQSFLNN